MTASTLQKRRAERNAERRAGKAREYKSVSRPKRRKKHWLAVAAFKWPGEPGVKKHVVKLPLGPRPALRVIDRKVQVTLPVDGVSVTYFYGDKASKRAAFAGRKRKVLSSAASNETLARVAELLGESIDEALASRETCVLAAFVEGNAELRAAFVPKRTMPKTGQRKKTNSPSAKKGLSSMRKLAQRVGGKARKLLDWMHDDWNGKAKPEQPRAEPPLPSLSKWTTKKKAGPTRVRTIDKPASKPMTDADVEMLLVQKERERANKDKPMSDADVEMLLVKKEKEKAQAKEDASPPKTKPRTFTPEQYRKEFGKCPDGTRFDTPTSKCVPQEGKTAEDVEDEMGMGGDEPDDDESEEPKPKAPEPEDAADDEPKQAPQKPKPKPKPKQAKQKPKPKPKVKFQGDPRARLGSRLGYKDDDEEEDVKPKKKKRKMAAAATPALVAAVLRAAAPLISRSPTTTVNAASLVLDKALVTKMERDLKQLTKLYRSIPAEDTPEAAATFEEVRTFFRTYQENFKEMIYERILGLGSPKESWAITQLKKLAWDLYIALEASFRYIDRGEQRRIPAPWTLKTERDKAIARYQRAARAFSAGFLEYIDWLARTEQSLEREELVESIHRAGFTVVIHNAERTNNRTSYSESKLSEMLNNLDTIAARISRAGFARSFEEMQLHIKFGIKDLTGGTYQPETDTLTIFSLGFEAKGKSLIHEIGHRFYFKNLPSNARRHWEQAMEERIAKVTPEAVNIWIDDVRPAAMKRYDESRLSRSPERIEPWLENLDESMAAQIRFLVNHDPAYTSVPEEIRRHHLKHNVGEQVMLEHITDYGATNAWEAFAEAFALYVLDGPSALKPWTRQFFKDITRSGGAKLRSSVGRPVLRHLKPQKKKRMAASTTHVVAVLRAAAQRLIVEDKTIKHDGWAYHLATADALESIKKNGLLPGFNEDRKYHVAKDGRAAMTQCKPLFFSKRGARYEVINAKRDVPLRFIWPKDAKLVQEDAQEEWYTCKGVKPWMIEVFTKGGWRQLTRKPRA